MRILLVLVAALVVAMTIATIVVGATNFEGTIVDKPYEAGLAFEADRANQAALGWSVALDIRDFPLGDNEVVIRLFDREKHPIVGAELGVRLSRPSTSAYDRNFVAAARSDSGYSAKLALPLPGVWDLSIKVGLGRDSTTFIQQLQAP